MILPSSGATFVLGGARSGKSRFAEQLVTASALDPHYVATGRAWDEEMRQRIDQHRADRGRPMRSRSISSVALPRSMQKIAPCSSIA
jgi:adenosyl cobinamide kinase/adenosyl cobinamide phosphate guanylyltransferase